MIVITDEMIEKAGRNRKDLRMELAIALYSSEVFDLRKSAEIAGVSWIAMADEVKKRNVPAWDTITVEEFEVQWERIQKDFLNQ